jgi:hypothetical protein
VVQLHDRLYELEPTGGPLHCELDDWNIDSDEIRPMYEIPDRPGIPGRRDRFTPEVHAICDELTEMTVQRRYAAPAYAERLLPMPDDATRMRPQ